MDARWIFVRLPRLFHEQSLEAILIGNAGAAIQGAPVTTLDIDFAFRSTPANVRKLKAIAAALDATIFRPYYPVSSMYRLSRDSDALQIDFMGKLDGAGSFEGLRRATTVDFDGFPLLVADLADIIKSKEAAGRPKDLAALHVLRRTLHEKKAATPKERRDALRKESDLGERDLIRRWLRLPPDRRTHFLRRKIGIVGSCI